MCLVYFLYVDDVLLWLGFTQSPIQWVLWNLCSEVKLQGREIYHPPLSSAEVKTGGAMPSLPNTSS
jgi:hypothetical protein